MNRRRSRSPFSPWSRGPEVADILACDDEQKLRDWTHAETGAPALGARPPGFEMGNQGAVRDAARPRR
jgi:formate-dependent nitrite reductase cytochrome c552 subunit